MRFLLNYIKLDLTIKKVHCGIFCGINSCFFSWGNVVINKNRQLLATRPCFIKGTDDARGRAGPFPDYASLYKKFSFSIAARLWSGNA